MRILVEQGWIKTLYSATSRPAKDTDAVGDGLRRSNVYVRNPSCKGVVRSNFNAEMLASRGVESIGNLIL